MIKVCVFGASGFVGRALIERLICHQEIQTVAVIHSYGNAWPILRYKIQFKQADLSEKESIKKAIHGCTHVVNLALGSFENMVSDLSNLLEVCKESNIKRLVHLSSITVYGDFPHKDSEFENGPSLAKKGTYGWFKNQQDILIERANKLGLSSVVLCPPHITGAYGRIFHQVIDSIKLGTFALVDNGSYPCNIVDINNLCQAIELALIVNNGDGKRIFITNGDNYTWKDLAIKATMVAGVEFDKIPTISAQQALSLGEEKLSLYRFTKNVLELQDVRNLAERTALLKNKLILKIAKKIWHLIRNQESNPQAIQEELTIITKTLNVNLCRQQLRGIRHKIDKANQVLNYNPTVNSFESFLIFEDYYKKLYGFNTEYWEIMNQ